MKNIIIIFLILSNITIAQINNECKSSPELIPILVKEKYGYCNKNGEIIIKPKFDDAEPFMRDWLYYSLDNENQKYGDINYASVVIKNKHYRIDKNGSIMCEWNPDLIDRNSMYQEKDFEFIQENNKIGIKVDSIIKIKCIYDEIKPLSNSRSNYFIVKLNNKYGVIDINENVLIPFKFEKLTNGDLDYNKIGLLKATLNNKIFYIDFCGNEYIK